MYQLTKEESDRIKIIKFTAIILVVYLHSYTTEVNYSEGTKMLALPVWLSALEKGVSQMVAGCGVPVFFLISAILFFRSNQGYGIVMKKKAKTLLLPYIIWNTFWIAVFVVLQSLSFTAPYFSGNNTPILQCSLQEWLGLYGIGQEYPQCYPLWFVRDLMVMILASPVIKAIVNRYPKIMMGIGIVLAVFPFHFYAKTALAWFILGAVIVRLQIHMTSLDKIAMSKIAAVYVICLVITFLADVSILRNLFILIGILFWTRLSEAIYSNHIICEKVLWMSQWTFMIYVIHELTLSSFRKICLRTFPISPIFLLAEYLLIPVFVIAGCIIFGIVFKRIMPGLYSLSTGGR